MQTVKQAVKNKIFSIVVAIFWLGIIQSADVSAQPAATCPCDYSQISKTTACWTEPFQGSPVRTEIDPSRCFLMNTYVAPPPPLPTSPMIHVVIGLVQVPNTTQWACSMVVSALFTQTPDCGFDGEMAQQNLTSVELAACKSDIEQYMTELNQVQGISVPGGPPYSCQIEESLLPAPPRNIPTLSMWGLIALAGVLGVIGFLVIRKRTSAA